MACNCWTSGPECCIRRSFYPYWVVPYKTEKTIAAEIVYDAYKDGKITPEQALKALKELE